MRSNLRTSLCTVLLLFLACGSSEMGDGDGVGQVDTTGQADNVGTDTAVQDAGADQLNSDGTGCVEGTTRCGGEGIVEICQDGEWIVLQVCDTPNICLNGICQTNILCEPGAVLGCLDAITVQRCSADGSGVENEPCPDGEFCTDGECSNQMCEPFSSHCKDLNTIEYCNAEGDTFENAEACDPGSVCIDGSCQSGCVADYKFGSYVGCEYWTVDLDQYEDPFGDPEVVPHAVVLSNPGDVDANVVFESFSSIPVTVPNGVVPAGTAVAFEMPRHDLDGSGIFNRSIRIRADHPVLAAQFNPFNNEDVASNDGTLLLPKAVLGTEYYILSWPSGPDISFPGLPAFTPQKGYVTVVAVEDGITSVVVRVTGPVEATLDAIANDVIVPVIEYPAHATFAVNLEKGQVLQLMAKPSTSLFGPPSDLTGTYVNADKPVMAFGGHEEAVIRGYPPPGAGADSPCCAEHLEEQMLPTYALSGQVLCGKSPPRGNDPDLWRILAVDDVVVSTDPVQVSTDGDTVTGITLAHGQYLDIKTEDSFMATADGRILVGQYLVSQGATDQHTGDPALIHGIPVEQWRDDYPILTPDGYSQDWLTVMKPKTGQVTLDGTLIDTSSFLSVGTTAYEVGWVAVTAGQHSVTGTEPFGLTEIGYSNAVSYGLAAGLNIKDLAQ